MDKIQRLNELLELLKEKKDDDYDLDREFSVLMKEFEGRVVLHTLNKDIRVGTFGYTFWYDDMWIQYSEIPKSKLVMEELAIDAITSIELFEKME